MREIKFNAVDEKTGEYARFDEFIDELKQENAFGYVEYRDDDTHNELLAKFLNYYYGYTLLISTGLKDKNGVEIYDGDIVHVTNKIMKIDEPMKVVFEDLMYKVISKNHSFVLAAPANSWTIRVIGNIYENKELLQ